MPRPLTPKTAIGAGEQFTHPIYLVRFSFPTALRLSSRGDIVFQGQTFSGAGIDYSAGSIAVLNEDLSYTASFMSNRGRTFVDIWISYGDAPFVDADFDNEFSGELGTRDFGDWITCGLKLFGANPEPHYYVGRPVLNHLLRAGSRLEFPTGSYPV